jgi:hypothetical protein
VLSFFTLISIKNVAKSQVANHASGVSCRGGKTELEKTLSSKLTVLPKLLSSALEVLLNSSLRFIVPAATVLVWKLAVLAYVIARFGGFTNFATPQMLTEHVGVGNPFYLFVHADSYYYMQIAQFGYPNLKAFAFFPGYPAIIRAFYFATSDIYLSTAVPAFMFGIAFIPVLQAVAEKYMNRQSALKCSIVAAFFPIILVVTIIGYSDSLFLFLSLAFWLEYMNHRIGLANLVLAAACLTRPFGVLLSIPLILDIVKNKQFKLMGYLVIPFLSVVGWLLYGFYSTGIWLAFRQAELTWTQTDWLRQTIIPLLAGGTLTLWAPTTFIVLVFGYLVYLTFQEDWRLGTLSLAMYASTIFFAGPPELSYPRYFSFIFPIWILAGKVRSWVLLGTYSIFMAFSSLLLLYAFVAGMWTP